MTGTLKTVALAFENLLAGATINPNDYLAFYAEEAEGGNPAYHHYKITVANLASQIAIAAPGSRKNLQIVTVSTTAINLTADFVALGPNSSIYPAASVSVSINTATSGAGGVDTGGISASQTYDIYLGHNPTTATTAAWLTIEGNAPTVPSGYANYQRIGWTRTDGSSNLYRIFQNNDHWQYVVMTSSNTASMIPLWSGTLGSWNTNAPGSYVSVSLSGHCSGEIGIREFGHIDEFIHKQRSQRGSQQQLHVVSIRASFQPPLRHERGIWSANTGRNTS